MNDENSFFQKSCKKIVHFSEHLQNSLKSTSNRLIEKFHLEYSKKKYLGAESQYLKKLKELIPEKQLLWLSEQSLLAKKTLQPLLGKAATFAHASGIWPPAIPDTWKDKSLDYWNNFSFFSTTNFIGLEQTGSIVKCASLSPDDKALELFTFQSEIEETEDSNVKRLYIKHPVIVSGLSGKQVLIRPLRLSLTKEKDIQEALPFQAEPILPYPADQAALTYQIISQTSDHTELTLLSATKDSVLKHIEKWHTLNIEPEKITSIPSALSAFATTYISATKTILLFHLQPAETTCILVKEGKILASFSGQEGLNLILEGEKKENISLPQTKEGWEELLKHNHLVSLATKKLCQEVTKIGYAITKESKNEPIDGVILTGEAATWKGFSHALFQNLSLPILECAETAHHTSEDLLSYAVPIGLSLDCISSSLKTIDFRQGELQYPHPWKRLQLPVILYFASILLLSFAFYFFGQQYLNHQENNIKQSYIELLAGLNKSYGEFEEHFEAKNQMLSTSGEISKIETLTPQDLSSRLLFLQKELQATPDSFPLFANIPRVSDVLAWLSQHSAVVSTDEEGNPQTRLQIENFNYTMVKRPQQGKKQDKYQVKIELEFSSPTPKWAREFHDALIAPNDWVDPKGEVKWNSNRGKYKTSFFLKDKTAYPSS